MRREDRMLDVRNNVAVGKLYNDGVVVGVRRSIDGWNDPPPRTDRMVHALGSSKKSSCFLATQLRPISVSDSQVDRRKDEYSISS